MALTKCPECGHEISDLAPLCPHCGKPMTQDADSAAVQDDSASLPALSSSHDSSAHLPSAHDSSLPQDAAASQEAGRKKPRIWPYIVLGFIVGLLILMATTCPKASMHRQEMQRVGERAVKIMAAKQNNMLVSGLSAIFGGKVVELFVNESLEVDDYFVVSIGRIVDPNITPKPQIVSVGVFGHIFTASPEMIADKMEKAISKAQQRFSTEIKNEVKNEIDEAINGVANGVRQEINDIVDEVVNEATDMANSMVDDVTSDVEQQIDDFLEQNKDK